MMLDRARQQTGDVARFRHDPYVWLMLQQKTHRRPQRWLVVGQ